MGSDDENGPARAMKLHLDHLVASEFTNSSQSDLAEQVLVENADARSILGEGLAMEAGKNHSFPLWEKQLNDDVTIGKNGKEWGSYRTSTVFPARLPETMVVAGECVFPRVSSF
jgi:hypothetical protein